VTVDNLPSCAKRAQLAGGNLSLFPKIGSSFEMTKAVRSPPLIAQIPLYFLSFRELIVV
jgi:hypothetical protein